MSVTENEKQILPSEDQIIEACKVKLKEFPELGIAKLLAQLQRENQWSLSEKRLKTILVKANLRKTKPLVNGKEENVPSYVPLSHLNTSLQIPEGVKAVYFDRIKGKGLIADQDFKEGQTIFHEDAFIASAPSQAMRQVEQGELCTNCFAPLAGSLVVRCGQKDCESRFCTRLCQSRAQTSHHPLLCSGQNSSIKPFNQFLSIQKWLSLAIVSKTLAKILLTHSNHAPISLYSSQNKNRIEDQPKASLEEMLSHFDAFATVSELERRARNPGWDVERSAFLTSMKEAHSLLCIGMDPRIDRKGKKWPIWKDFPIEVAEKLFSWNNFILLLGRANINTEAQGGMYLIHSHLNHSCSPNVTVRHPPSRHGIRQATKIAAIAKTKIKKGDELVITYQDPSLELSRRRMLLWREYMFGPCECQRCVEELNGLNEEQKKEMENGSWKFDEMEKEEIQKRKEHAEMLNELERQKMEKLRAEGKGLEEEEKEKREMEEELRTHLGF